MPGVQSCSEHDEDDLADDDDTAGDDDDTAGDDDDSAGDDDDSAGDDDDSAGEETLLSAQECDRICSEREQGIEGTGNCPFEWNSGDCRQVCADYALFSVETEQAFMQCVATDPLCFLDIHDCVVNARYPEPTTASFSLVATGFGAYESEPVVVALQAVGDTFVYAPAQTVLSGGFAAQWIQEVYVGGAHLVLYYLDLDGDGSCSPSIDLTGSIQMVLGADIDVPSFSAEVELPTNSADFVCDFI